MRKGRAFFNYWSAIFVWLTERQQKQESIDVKLSGGKNE